MFSTGFSMATDRIAEPDDGPSTQFLARAGARARRLGVRFGPGARAGARRGRTTGWCSPARAARCTTTTRSTRSRTAASTSTTPRATSFLTVDVEGLRVSFFVCYDLRFADEFWALAPDDRLLRRRRELARESRARTGVRCSRRARSRTRRTSSASTASAKASRLAYAGDSMIVDPLGESLATAAQHGDDHQRGRSMPRRSRRSGPSSRSSRPPLRRTRRRGRQFVAIQ